MASPIIIGITPVTVVPINTKRSIVRLQNTGVTTITIKKIPLDGPFTPVSITDYDVLLGPLAAPGEGGEAFETNSISSFMAISSAVGGILAIYETVKA